MSRPLDGWVIPRSECEENIQIFVCDGISGITSVCMQQMWQNDQIASHRTLVEITVILIMAVDPILMEYICSVQVITCVQQM